jgi:error-prone DNA polymerase
MQSLHRTRPENLDDLTIQVAIVRPGPILGGAVNPYISRRQRLREDPDFVVPYDHPSLEPVLRDTLGTIIFQDQVIEVAMAFAGFSPGEAEGLRRAMSRKRSAEAIEGYHQRFVDGAARTHGVDAATAERVYEMIVGFSGFGFPKAHGAAFGLLAYQSTWLRVHYAPEFLCALLNEQPMGFYAPDTLAHEAQRRGIELIAPDVNLSAEECTVDAEGRIRLGLNYVVGARSAELAALVAAREAGGPFRSLADLAARAGAGRAVLDRLAWAGACDALAAADGAARAEAAAAGADRAEASSAAAGRAVRAEAAAAGAKRTEASSSTAGRAVRAEAAVAGADRAGASSAAAGRAVRAPMSSATDSGALAGAPPTRARRTALWELGVAAPGVSVGEEGTQLSLPLELPAAPELDPLAAWDAMVADYATIGLTLGDHPIALLRSELPGAVTTADLERLPHKAPVRIAGLVAARQRPGTAKGIVFLLLEDEFGTINLIVPPDVYERHRLLVRSEPLLLATGRLEKLPIAGGALNVYVHDLRAVSAPGVTGADVVPLRDPAPVEAPDAAPALAAAAAARPSLVAAGGAAPSLAAAGAAPPSLATVGAGGAGPASPGEVPADAAMAAFRGVAPPIQSFASGRRR